MKIRSISLAVALIGLAIGAVAEGRVTIKGVKGAMADCYGDRNLDKAIAVVRKEEWPGPLVAADEYEDAVYVVVAGRKCWFDRAEVVVDAPTVVDCVDGTGGLSSRGLGDKKCTPQKKAR